MPDFASLLLEARAKAGLTQSQVASAAGLTPSYLSFIENKKKPPPSDEVCVRLAAALGIPAERLLEIAHLERAPAPLRRRVDHMEHILRKERKSRTRLLRNLLSPFLFAGSPGYLDSAIDAIGLGPRRRQRLREVLAALGRHHTQAEPEVSRVLDSLPESERVLLLEALPRILGHQPGVPPTRRGVPRTGAGDAQGGARAGSRHGGGPQPGLGAAEAAGASLRYAPVRWADAPPEPYLLAVDAPLAAGVPELEGGDRVLVDPRATPQSGDLLVFAGEGGGSILRLLECEPPGEPPADRVPPDAGTPVLHAESRSAAPAPQGLARWYRLSGSGTDPVFPSTPKRIARDPMEAGEFDSLWANSGAGVVIEIRRPLRHRGGSSDSRSPRHVSEADDPRGGHDRGGHPPRGPDSE